MIGEARSQPSIRAQKAARGIKEAAVHGPDSRLGVHWTSDVLRNPALSAPSWATRIIEDVAAGTGRTGNHVCRPDVCHKGRIGRLGFCRMFYWHWPRRNDEKKGLLAIRSHGLELSPRWDGVGDPPVLTSPPFIGAPALEITHPFHFNMCPSMLLGPS